MKPFAYGKDWSFSYHRVREPMSEARAKESHLRRSPFSQYAAVFGSPEHPTCSVVVSFSDEHTFYVVSWIDEYKRKHMEFQFRLEPNGRLFLILASEFWYEDATSKVVRVVHYKFETDGRIHVDDFDKVTMMHQFKEDRIDVSGNWENVPPFGEYDGLLVKERDRRYRSKGP